MQIFIISMHTSLVCEIWWWTHGATRRDDHFAQRINKRLKDEDILKDENTKKNYITNIIIQKINTMYIYKYGGFMYL